MTKQKIRLDMYFEEHPGRTMSPGEPRYLFRVVTNPFEYPGVLNTGDRVSFPAPFCGCSYDREAIVMGFSHDFKQVPTAVLIGKIPTVDSEQSVNSPEFYQWKNLVHQIISANLKSRQGKKDLFPWNEINYANIYHAMTGDIITIHPVDAKEKPRRFFRTPQILEYSRGRLVCNLPKNFKEMEEWAKSEEGKKSLDKKLEGFFHQQINFTADQLNMDIVKSNSDLFLKERLPDYWHFCDEKMREEY